MPQKAIITLTQNHASLVTNRPLPSPRDDYILVRTTAVALNPIDWMLLASTPAPNAVMGHDYAGTVLDVGNSVRGRFKPGDRVCGMVKGGDATRIENGAFAEYIVAKAGVQMKIPDAVEFADAATAGVGVVSAGMCLFGRGGLGMRFPGLEVGDDAQSKDRAVLIYGGSSASGLWGIQFAKLAGYTVITTCSPRNFDLVRRFGADAVCDYRGPECIQRIREYAANGLRFVYDTIATEESARICSEAICPAGGRYHSLLPVPPFLRPEIHCSWVNCSVAMGEAFEYGPERMEIPAMPEEFEFVSRWTTMVEALWAEGKLRTPVVEARQNGLGGVLDGLKDLKEGKISGKKLVYLV
ncbi:hypothetical protein P175DRAFT_0525295 [Aspergillus ochraceoroseus IBT 24754]|uniref:Enoyl reductase (ER) domain-containing protein n=1 Tax=Aspergillus ochraceoroseus IBT 24754 TaxID=1392256 RepID=A0A2T5LQC5_9EURO|nr:uncharacterized protein P175DRAFT_0525295 [Aspergillus ochraceoroseus IBT 24754]PTU18494.1 hypothetical protein P175DRAFT_0525295 [Aspergillus ochraceoroseus IBT 24754]